MIHSYCQNENISGFLESAQNRAAKILAGNYVVSSNHGRSRCYFDGVIVNNNYGGRRNNDNSAAAFALGAIMVIAGSFLFGMFLRKRDDALNKLEDARAAKLVIKDCKREGRTPELDKIIRVRRTYAQIFKNRVMSQNINIALTVSAIATGVFLIISAVAASQAAIASALILGVVIGAAAAFKAGYDYFSRAEKDKAKKIDMLVDEIFHDAGFSYFVPKSQENPFTDHPFDYKNYGEEPAVYQGSYMPKEWKPVTVFHSNS